MSLPFGFQFRTGVPVYEQILYAAQKAMISGQLQPGDAFPSVRQLSQELKINPNTAQKAITALRQEGLLEVVPGIGTLVASPGKASAEEKAVLLGEDVENLVVQARQAGLELDALLAAVRRHWRKFGP
jgi:GntR family transcriptional regulator